MVDSNQGLNLEVALVRWTFSVHIDPDSKFAVSGSSLQTNATLDYESATSHQVTIRATDGTDIIGRTFTITVTDVVNEFPANGGLITNGFKDFTHADWVNHDVTVTANNTTAPDGTATADKLESAAADAFLHHNATVLDATQYTFSVYLKADSATTINIYGINIVTPAVCNVTTSWQRFYVTYTTNTTVGQVQIGGGSTFTTGEIVYAWAARWIEGAVP